MRAGNDLKALAVQGRHSVIGMIGKFQLSRWLASAAILAAADCAGVVAVEFALTTPAQAQFFDSRSPFSRQRSQRPSGAFDNMFGNPGRPAFEEGIEAPVDNSRAPSPRKAD